MLGCTVSGIKKSGLGFAYYNATASGSITRDSNGDPDTVSLSCSANGHGLEVGHVQLSISGTKTNGESWSRNETYDIAPGNPVSEGMSTSEHGVTLDAGSNATATAYVEGTTAGDDDGGREHKVFWKANRDRFECLTRNRNNDGWAGVHCTPPEPN